MIKKVVLLLEMLVCCSFPFLSVVAQASSQPLTFKERVFDFGEIKEQDGVVSHIFVFKNESKIPVSISRVRSGCSCISIRFSSEPVRPGEKAAVTVSYNPAYRSGFFSKEIVVLSNNGKAYNRIWIKGIVVPRRSSSGSD